MTWLYYDVDGYDKPLLLSPERAAELGATEHSDEPPTARSSKQAWVDYALAQGADPNVVASSTKQELIDEYGVA